MFTAVFSFCHMSFQVQITLLWDSMDITDLKKKKRRTLLPQKVGTTGPMLIPGRGTVEASRTTHPCISWDFQSPGVWSPLLFALIGPLGRLPLQASTCQDS